MMKTKYMRLTLLIGILNISVILGCGTLWEDHRGATVGAGVGATAGAIAGAALGDSTGTTVLSGLAGALVGGVIGHYFYDRDRDRAETASAHGYHSSQGAVLTIEEASISPQRVKAGDTVNVRITYAVLNPSANTKTKIREIREITYNGEIVGRPEVSQFRSDGTFTSTVPLHLPAGAQNGHYRVKVTVESENAKDTREISFTVS